MRNKRDKGDRGQVPAFDEPLPLDNPEILRQVLTDTLNECISAGPTRPLPSFLPSKKRCKSCRSQKPEASLASMLQEQ